MAEDINFVSPRLPDPPKEYNSQSFEQFNSVLRIYFNQLDDGLRKAVVSPETQAQVWFLG